MERFTKKFGAQTVEGRKAVARSRRPPAAPKAPKIKAAKAPEAGDAERERKKPPFSGERGTERGTEVPPHTHGFSPAGIRKGSDSSGPFVLTASFRSSRATRWRRRSIR